MAQWTYRNAFVCAAKVSKGLKSFNPRIPREIETIVDYFKDYLAPLRGNIAIRFHPRAYEAKIFYGTIEDFGSMVEIYYDINRNHCWKRFVCAKELCHLLYNDGDKLHCSASVEEIDSLMSQILAGVVADQAATSEQATILMAIEVLLPHFERASAIKLLSKGGVAAVAQHYRLPVQMVGAYFNHSYIALAQQAVKDLEG